MNEMKNRRVAKELERLQKDPIPGIVITPQADEEDCITWIAAFEGAADTLFEGEAFQLMFKFSAQYPIDAPEVVFLQPAPVHPHIYSNGHICLVSALKKLNEPSIAPRPTSCRCSFLATRASCMTSGHRR